MPVIPIWKALLRTIARDKTRPSLFGDQNGRGLARIVEAGSMVEEDRIVASRPTWSRAPPLITEKNRSC
jgi:hypothetical protein